MKQLEAFKSGDGAHCGLTDWYPKKEEALEQALKSGEPFDTGWYASKKEIASARIYRASKDKEVRVEVSVSDDFDTYGMGSAMLIGPNPKSTEQARRAIHKAWAEAEKNQKDNRTYRAYSIIKHEKSGCTAWVDTYLVNTEGMDSPTGDNYHFWGWQSDPCDEHPTDKNVIVFRDNQGEKPSPKLRIPKKTIEAFEDHAQSLKKTNLRIGKWEIKSWDAEGETK